MFSLSSDSVAFMVDRFFVLMSKQMAIENTFRLIDDLIVINGNSLFGKYQNETYPAGLGLEK